MALCMEIMLFIHFLADTLTSIMWGLKRHKYWSENILQELSIIKTSSPDIDIWVDIENSNDEF